ncbi:MAG: hypothetical protein GXX09_11330 [Syntrophomonadaceae bacterium]|nr:hypothetical protein [Syntrophomonadaceae bacterium]
MKKKSKLVAFIFSIVPGISHLYAGCSQRALIFFALFLGMVFGGFILAELVHRIAAAFTLFGLAVVWFVALVDVFILIDSQEEDSGGDSYGGITTFLNNRKIITVALSVVPGAGHMYLGLLKQGTQLMTAFFLILFLTGWLDLGFMAFILPVIWFYSLFDAYHLVEESGSLRPDDATGFRWLEKHPNWVGWGLIILGVLLILRKIVAPFVAPLIDYQMYSYMQTGIVALVLIAIGIKLLAGNRYPEKEEKVPCDSGE